MSETCAAPYCGCHRRAEREAEIAALAERAEKAEREYDEAIDGLTRMTEVANELEQLQKKADDHRRLYEAACKERDQYRSERLAMAKRCTELASKVEELESRLKEPE